MINLVVLEGRLTNDLDLRVTNSNKKTISFTVACNRGKSKDGKDLGSDFIKCVAWENTATFISNYFKKGDGIAVQGKINTRDYEDQQGKKVYVTEVIVDKASFPEGKKAEAPSPTPVTPTFSFSRDDLPF